MRSTLLTLGTALLLASPAAAQIERGPDGPFLAVDAVGRVLGAADIIGSVGAVAWISANGSAMPITLDRDRIIGQTVLYESSDCSGQAYTFYHIPGPANQRLFVGDDTSLSLYTYDPQTATSRTIASQYTLASGCSSVGPYSQTVSALTLIDTLAGEFVDPISVVPNPDYGVASVVPLGARWLLVGAIGGLAWRWSRRAEAGDPL